MTRQQFKAKSLEMERGLLQFPEARKVVLVTKLKKGNGLEELETW
jgi:hypothetical protein